MREFILCCKEFLGDRPFLWVAFQSNTLNDRCGTTKEFQPKFEEMIESLRKEFHFYSPKLALNMRNSSEVGELAQTLRSDYGDRKITSIIESLPAPKSSVTSAKPTFFPMPSKDFHQKENCDEILKRTTENGQIKVILIAGADDYDLEMFRHAIVECGINEEDIFIHTFKSNNTKEDIAKFLQNQNGFLICEAELFTGMEADSVVYCVRDWDRDKNMRVNVTRACSKLNIIYLYIKDHGNIIDFSSIRLDPTFMTGCEEEMKRFAHQCLTCEKNGNMHNDKVVDNNTIIVCKSCFIGCHFGHVGKWHRSKKLQKDLKINAIMCECKIKCKNCIFRS